PYLNEKGVRLPGVRGWGVAEAHRRGLERGEAERDSAQARRAAAPAPLVTGTPGIAPARSPFGPPPSPAPALTTSAPSPAAPRPAPPEVSAPVRRFTPPMETPAAHQRETVPLPSRPIEERPHELTPALPTRTTSVATPSRVTTANVEAEQRPAASAAPTTPTRGASRYWDQPVPGPRFSRLRPEPAEPAAEQPPLAATQPVAPPRGPSELPAEPPRRTIRSLGTTPAAETQPVVPPPPPAEESRPVMQRLPRTEPAVVAPPPAPPEVAPRQVDETLLQQLAAEWRSQALEALAGQHCGSCRYFQTSDGQHGSCACQFTPCYRQPVGGGELGCLTGLGTWWAPTDEGWLQRAEPRRPRRATPLLDALEREVALAEQAASRGRERRRNVR
ncbi:MAG: hypothetical protein ACTHMU_02625, partial [Thermomicrobiales bacterium]